jgi:arabinofuranosyltransferase
VADTGSDRVRGLPWSRSLHWVILGLPLLIYVERAWARRRISPDGFIYLRVVKQLLAGNGPVFNAGERVEAATGPLWTLVLAVGDLLTPVRLEWLAVLLGIGLTIAGLVFAIAGARRLLVIERSDLAIPIGIAVIVATPPMWMFASSGLETGLSFAWLGACFWILARWSKHNAGLAIWEAVILGLGSLIRPDFWLFTFGFVGIVVFATDDWRGRLRVLAGALAIPLLYQLFRMGYYGVLAPNTAFAKEAGRSRWDTGWDYLTETVGPYGLWLPVAVLAVGAYLPMVMSLRRKGLRRELLVTTAFAVTALVHVIYVVKVGGDFMYARLLLPGLFAFAIPVAVVPARREYVASLLILPWAFTSLFFLRSENDRYLEAIGNRVTTDDWKWGRGSGALETYSSPGFYYTDQLLPVFSAGEHNKIVATYGVGAGTYALGTDVYVLDLLGLGDPFTAHLELERRGFTGHEKPLPPPWIVARFLTEDADVTEEDFPFPAVLANLGRRIDDPGNEPFEERVRAARAALRCKDLRAFQRSYDAPLTAGRFVDNLFDAFSNSSFRIPPEPRNARAKFCAATQRK